MTYAPRRTGLSRFLPVRNLRYHLTTWGDESLVTAQRPPLVMLHGWMDVGASFQFVVDALAEVEVDERLIVALDWRGFGLTETPGADTFWFADYLADLDAVLHALFPQGAVDLLGHSMGGNVAMSYSGVRPARVRRLVNLEGFGMPEAQPHQAPKRLAQWLDELRQPAQLRPYDSLQAVADRLIKNNPLLTADKAAWLAPHWAGLGDDLKWRIRGNPSHKRVNPVLYRKEEVLAAWRLISAPVLWAEGDRTDVAKWWGHRYPRSDFEARLAVVPHVKRALLSPCGHMLHHDQPQALATHLSDFLNAD
mgnify:CR=1 FL=1